MPRTVRTISTIAAQSRSPASTLHLPMTWKDGQGKFFVGATVAEALWVAAHCGLLIFSRAQDALYRVMRQDEGKR